ncbi:transcriptional regulator GutM [Streptococcus cuniculi]|uniref:Uncharacterized protein n=1 Tax=Streptococcus cuniculi TaxID=1432788 RepID=A0A4Y9JBA4_9STRE|nr:transcriptional regulator GutM [Streptococcus cuniculi]MBF0777927.1 hypothetical protein [Streptococcus cuniculi]TFU98222.1 hypothetical protein E4T82_04245 [Streptococcus cuniculi]
MAKLAIVLTVILLFQLILSLYQVRYYQQFMSDLVEKYKHTSDYYLVSEVVKSRLSSNTLALIHNKNKVIIEAYYLRGMTIFSKFKPCDAVVGHCLNKQLLAVVQGDKLKERAISMLIEKSGQ